MLQMIAAGVLLALVLGVLGWIAVALILVATQPLGPRPVTKSRKFAEEIERPPSRRIPLVTVRMRDGWDMPVRHLPGPRDAPLLVLLHGSGWHGQQLEDLAIRLSDAATVVVPDLRGHGATPERRGDIDHLGQIEEDIADLVLNLLRADQGVVIAGHSSGAGTAIRFCGGRYGRLADAAVLLSPYLHHTAPTYPRRKGGWADLATRRLLGLEMLNALGLHGLDHLWVTQFAMPQSVLDGPLGHTATLRYTHRLNASLLPRRRWWRDVARLPQFTLVAGAEDRAFHAQAFAPVMKAITDRGRYHIIPGVGHPDVVHHEVTDRAFREVLDAQRRHSTMRGPRVTGRPGAVPGDHGRAGAGAGSAVPDLRVQHRSGARALDDT